MSNQQLIGFKRLSEITGISVKTLRGHRFSGEGIGSVGFKVDGRVLFEVADVEQYIERCKELERREREAILNGG